MPQKQADLADAEGWRPRGGALAPGLGSTRRPLAGAGRPGARRVVADARARWSAGGGGQPIDSSDRRSADGARLFEYVKVCSLYGAGFFYIPGTDTCLKIGGFVRAEYGFNASGSHGQYWSGQNAVYNRYTDDFRTRVRFNYTFDARTQTEYGTLRSYIRAGLQFTTDDAADGLIYYDRAFIQLGGFTFGRTVSFFDAWSGGGVSITSLFGASDTGGGINVAAYTATFGNGFSGTIAIEDPTRRRDPGIWSTADALPAAGAALTNRYGGMQVPDIVGNLRVDQAWGSAQLSAALHQVRASYYGASPGTEGLGAPEDKWGFAVQGAVQVKLPWAAGDTFTIQGTYAEGANHYANVTSGSTYGIYSGTSVFEGLAFEGVYGGVGTGIELTKVFGVNAGIEHYWTPMLRTSLFGSYTSVDFNGTATDYFCGGLAGCNPDWNVWQLGTKTTWNPVRNLDVSLEVLYSKFETEHAAGIGRLMAPGNAKPALVYSYEDMDVFSGFVRIQRNFWP